MIEDMAIDYFRNLDKEEKKKLMKRIFDSLSKEEKLEIAKMLVRK
jgi:uncharacterized protein (DUF2164 family)